MLLKLLKDLFIANFTSIKLVYPNLANSTVITGGAGAWGNGSYAEVIPASTIIKKYVIIGVNIENVSAADIFQLRVSGGLASAETPIANLRFIQAGFYPINSQILTENTRISCRLASAAGGAKTVKVSIVYAEYI